MQNYDLFDLRDWVYMQAIEIPLVLLKLTKDWTYNVIVHIMRRSRCISTKHGLVLLLIMSIRNDFLECENSCAVESNNRIDAKVSIV